jgi:nucleoid DNA-binding protein
VAAVAGVRPELLQEPPAAARAPRYAAVAAYGLLIALGLVLFVAPVASGLPDGLARVAGNRKLFLKLLRQFVEQQGPAVGQITEALAKGDKVELRKFGVFEVKVRKARVGRNPNKPETDVPIPARSMVKFKAGKEKAFNSLVGQAMKATKGKANPAQVNAILKAKLAR